MPRKLPSWVWTVIALGALLVYLGRVVLPAAYRSTNGFAAYYTASHLLAAGPTAMAQVYDNAWFGSQVRQTGFPDVADIFNIQPPTMSLILLPLAGLPPPTARLAWILFSLVCLVGGLVVLGRALAQPWLWGLWVTPLALLYAPVSETIRLGQAYLLLFFLLSLFVWALVRWPPRRRTSATAGISLGLLLILKTTGVWLWPLLAAARRWSILGWGMLTAGVIALVTLPWTGSTAWRTYLSLVPTLAGKPERTVTAYQTLASLAGHLFDFDVRFNPQPVADVPALASVITLAALAGLLIVSIRCNRIDDPQHARRVLSAAMMGSLLVVTAPLGEGYHYVLVLPSLVMALWWAWRVRPGVVAWIVLVGATVLMAAPLPYTHPRLAEGWWSLLAYPRAYGALVLWGWLVWVLRRPPGREDIREPVVAG